MKSSWERMLELFEDEAPDLKPLLTRILEIESMFGSADGKAARQEIENAIVQALSKGLAS